MAALERINALLESAEEDGAHGHAVYRLIRDALIVLAEEIDKAKKPVFTPAVAAKKPDTPASVKTEG